MGRGGLRLAWDTETKPHMPRAHPTSRQPCSGAHLPAPAMCPPPRAKTALALRVWRPLHNANWGAFFPPELWRPRPCDCAPHGHANSGRGDWGRGRGRSGRLLLPRPHQPPLGTRSPTSVLFLARRGSSAGGGLREEPEVSELAGETTQEQPRWGGGPWVESWVGSPRDPPHRPGLQAQGDGKMAFLLPSYQRPPDQTGVSGALAMEMGVQDGTESSFWGRLGGRAPGAPLLGCWFGFALKPRLLR